MLTDVDSTMYYANYHSALKAQYTTAIETTLCYIFLRFRGEISLDITCESSAGRWFTYNVDAYLDDWRQRHNSKFRLGHLKRKYRNVSSLRHRASNRNCMCTGYMTLLWQHFTEGFSGSKPLIGSAGPGKFDNIRGYPSILGSKYTLLHFIL